MKFKQFLEEAYACAKQEDVLNESSLTSKNKHHLEQMDSYIEKLETLLDLSDSGYQKRFKSHIASRVNYNVAREIYYIPIKNAESVKKLFDEWGSGPRYKNSHIPCELWEGVRCWGFIEVVNRLCHKTRDVASGLAERMHKDVKSASKSRKSQSKK